MGTIDHVPGRVPPSAHPASLMSWVPVLAALLVGFALGGIVFSRGGRKAEAGASVRVQAPALPPSPVPVQVASTPAPMHAPEQASRPAPPAVVPPEPDDSPHSFWGNGSTATELIRLAPGLHTFKLSHGGERNFIVVLMDERGQRIDTLANEIGMQTLSKAVRIPLAGRYLLNVQADGQWTADVTVPAGASASNAGAKLNRADFPTAQQLGTMDALATMQEQSGIALKALERGDRAAYREAAHKANEAARKLDRNGRVPFDDVY